MTAMNRLYRLHIEKQLFAQADERGMGNSFMCSTLDKHKRENCVLVRELQV